MRQLTRELRSVIESLDHLPIFQDTRNLIKRWGPIPTSSDSEETYAFIRKQLDTCVRSHLDCRGKKESFKLPRRLIDLQSGSNALKLLDTNEHPLEDKKYATLSYCWGQNHFSQTLLLTTASIPSLKTRISWEQLPKAFQDAITICTRLEIEFLWIDSLCILQDSKPDWEAESAQMCDYFRNAYITISADFIASPSESFLGLRNSEFASHAFKIPSRSVKGSDIATDRDPYVYASGTCLSLISEVSPMFQSPLSRRGWTFQESLLSPRVIHYLSSEILFECRSLKECESGAPVGQKYGLCQQVEALKTYPPFLIWQIWVEVYSQRVLTREADRLPAIGGAAKVIQEVTGSKYLAGLWENNIIADLLWDTHWPMVERKEDVPSWSWISTKSSVVFPVTAQRDRVDLQGFYPLAELLDTRVNVSGKNAFGQVEYGQLQIRGPLFEAHISHTEDDGTTVDLVINDSDQQIRKKSLDLVSMDALVVETTSSIFEGISLRKGTTPDESEKPYKDVTGHCLYMGKYTWSSPLDEKQILKHRHELLLLGRSPHTNDAFVRLGKCRVHNKEWMQDLLDDECYVKTITIV